MAYGVVRTDNMLGTIDGAYLVSLYCENAIENGNVVVVGALKTGEREVHAFTTPAANSAFDAIALVASEEVVKTNNAATLGQFRNEVGTIARGYRLHKHDVFSVSADAIEGTSIAVGFIVELQAKTKLKAVENATASTTTIGKVIAIETDGATTWYVVEVA